MMGWKPQGFFSRNRYSVIAAAVLVAALVTAGAILVAARHRRAVLVDEVRAISTIKMKVISEQVGGCFEGVAKDLRLISHHADVKAWRPEAKEFIKAIYLANRRYHYLTEVYLIEKSFDGKRRPFITCEFEEKKEGEGKHTDEGEEDHDAEKEAEEYAIQLKHIARFAADPTLEIQISSPLGLCADMEGVVMSVPVRRDGELLGIVAGMISLESVRRPMEGPACHEVAALLDRQGGVVVCKDMSEALERQVQSHAEEWKGRGIVGGKISVPGEPERILTTAVITIDGEPMWDLLYLHDEGKHLAEVGGHHQTAEWLGALLVVALGGAVAFLCRMVGALGALRREADRQKEEVRQREQDLSITLNSIGDAVIATDVQGRVTRMNPVAEKLTGWPLAEARGQLLSEVFHIIDAKTGEPAADPARRVLACGQVVELAEDTALLSRTGERHAIADSAAPIRGASGEIQGVVLVFQDVTQRRLAEESLRASEARMRAITDSAQDAILMMDPHGRISHWNPAAETIFGFSRVEAIGQNLHDLIVPKRYHEAQQAAIGEFHRSGRGAAVGQTLEMQAMRKDGREITVALSLSGVRLGDQWHAVGILRDITEQKRAEDALRQSEEKHRLIFHTAASLINCVDEHGILVDTNARMPEVLGYDRQEVVGQSISRFIHPDDLPGVRKNLQEVIANGQAAGNEFRMVRKDGQTIDVRVNSSAMRGPDGRFLYALRIVEDITRHKQIERELCETNRYLGQLNEQLESAAGQIKGLMDDVVNRNLLSGRFVNSCLIPCWEEKKCGQTTCPSYDNRKNLRCWEVAGTYCGGKVQGTFAKKLGDCRKCEVYQRARANPVMDMGESFNTMIAILNERHQQLHHASSHDALTGLPNRAMLRERLQQAIVRSQEDKNYRFAVLFLDFDRFKTINDSLGHEVGDLLLKEIAGRLQGAVRGGDTLGRFGDQHVTARLGGDEFVVLLEGIGGPQDAVGVANRLLETFAKPYQLGEHEAYSTASIGIVTSDMAAQSADEVLGDADTAMYEAKLAGKGRSVVFDVPMHDRVRNRLRLENDLRKAIAAGQLFLMYQPIISLQTGQLESFEALVRWRHPERGLVPPAEFIPIAEDTGLIVTIGEWVLRQACTQFAQWRQSLGAAAPRSLSVNLSRNQLLMANLPETIRGILQETGVPAENLHLEITESAVMRDPELATRVLRAIKEVGAKLDMDDFGTGHSSLACLHQFPIDVLKIDRSFVANIERGRDFAALVHAVTQLARNLGIVVVAEGIETMDQVAILQSLECDFGQGYVFSKPLLAAEVGDYVVRPGLTPSQAA
jgi:diguanylate cyclase (GGDEF)-like protein/PAS domain S-box-containing protein